MSPEALPPAGAGETPAPRVLHPPERERTTTPYGGAAAEDRHQDATGPMRHKQPRHVRAPSEDVPLRPAAPAPPVERPGPGPSPPASLPPHRSGPPPVAGRDWPATGPRAARRAAVEARDPAPPRAPAPARGKRAARAGAPKAPGRRDPASPPPSRGPRRVAEPRPVRVRADEHGRPLSVAGRAVEAVRESWLVEDRWWTDAPLRRRYWEVVTTDGRNRAIFRDLEAGAWFSQRA